MKKVFVMIVVLGIIGLGGYLISKDILSNSKSNVVSNSDAKVSALNNSGIVVKDEHNSDAEFLKDKLYQVGSPVVGSGYNDLYYFDKNNEYYYFTSEMDGETSLRAEKGLWEIKDNKLVLTATKTVSYINGHFVEPYASYASDKVLEDYDIEIKTVNEVKEYDYKIMTEKIEGYENLGEDNVLRLNDTNWYLGGYAFDEYFINGDNVKYLNEEDNIIYNK